MKKKVDMDLSQISTIFFDVDGVFTDESFYISDNDVTSVSKRFAKIAF